ncbi:MAG: hypothetical protein A3C02_00385 [Candidatus Andersenbacteria bacterium RIFCSPHIGHO2_02_FULL_45_11]|uniref:DUF4258 domain-containing protein n=1 Tax=Candidatus Andersenbacteria bacterium RIFCSPHIGHO2_12_FULL_45_11 TaxID=1797281 RepID=A0A1G1WZX7_9BACT|nr:MAG: hypothetical protein A3D99_03150 [Candidatus Andersenbacteria bacterium RIFCSPHIGHO2_12_FULL_45_11]OGY34646.1 MAG: hypothetical protein A3C02_00385 [Candidatus Andersenbacteria bacterium RIFCSPHIGHO2_02_FULL_45_11]
MLLRFTKHAQEKFAILKKHSFLVTRRQVTNAVLKPDLIDHSRLPLHIAQKTIDDTHVLRVVYKREGRIKVIITFYPGRKSSYEKRK